MAYYESTSVIKRDETEIEKEHVVEATVRELVQIGEGFLSNRRFEDALACFENARALNPMHREALKGYNRVLSKMVPRWHFFMLNDIKRNQAFEDALHEIIDPSMLVLDIGTGSGLLAMLAAREGAEYVVSCEMLSPLAKMASRVIRANGFGERVQVLPKSSLDLQIGLDLPRRADLLVTEIVDCGLLGEMVIPTLRHARQHLLRNGGTMIPRSARVIAALLESEQVHKLNHVQEARSFDVSHFNEFSTAGYFPVRLNTWQHRFLTKPQEIFRFDFLLDTLLPTERQVNFVASAAGLCHGFVFWFEMDLNDHITISNDPANVTTHWMQAVQCLERPIEVTEGQVVEAIVAHDDASIWFDL